MDPATIGLLISIAPTILELLFGRGNNIIKHETLLENPEKMYGYGLEGYGYRYPRRRREVTVQTYFPQEAQPKLIRAAVFNRAIAAKNPWVQFLQNRGYLKKVSDTFREAAEEYRKEHPYDPKQRANLERQLLRLKAEKEILDKEKQSKALGPEFQQRYPGLDYAQFIEDKITKLNNDVKRINAYLEALNNPQLLGAKK